MNDTKEKTDGHIISALKMAMRLFPPEINGLEKAERYRWNKDIHPEAWEGLPKVDVYSLMIDTSYQRSITSINSIDAICRDFDCRQFCAILVNRKNRCIIDGDHRVMAVIRRGDIRYVPVVFIDVETKQEEARLFVEKNTRPIAVRAIDKFRAAIVAKDPTALSISQMITEFGMKIDHSPLPNSISCVHKIITLYRKSPDALWSAIRFLRLVDEGKQISKDLIDAAFYCQYHGVEIFPYVEKIKSLGGFTAITQEGKSLSIEFGKSISNKTSERIMGQALLNLINYKCRTKHQAFTNINK